MYTQFYDAYTRRHRFSLRKTVPLLGLAFLLILPLLILPSQSVHASSPPAWSAQSRSVLTITNTSSTTALPIGYTITDDISGIGGTTAATTHIVYWNGSINTELDRDYETDAATGKMYARFELQASIAASGSDSSSYWLYYGTAGNTSAPLANMSNVYVHYTDFTNIGSGNTWDSSYWGTEPGCIANIPSGAQNSTNGCTFSSISTYGVGYATEFTANVTAVGTTGYAIPTYGFKSPTGGGNAEIVILDNFLGTSESTDYNSSGPWTTLSPAVSISPNTWHVMGTTRNDTTTNSFNVDFGSSTNNTTGVPVDAEYCYFYNYIPSGSDTTVLSAFRLRLAIDSEPMVLNSLPSSNPVSALAISSGSLAISSISNFSYSTALNGQDQTVSTGPTISLIDATGSAAGWNMTLTSTTFTNGGHTLPVTATTMTGLSSGCGTNSTCTPATNTVSYPVGVPAATSPPTAVKIFNAAANTGLGTITSAPVFSILLPANLYTGTYTSTFTLTLVSGP